MLWAHEPRQTADHALPHRALAVRQALADAPALRRIEGTRRQLRHDPTLLRAVILREGYLYASEPSEALALVNRVSLADLFVEPKLFLLRGSRIDRVIRRAGRTVEYRYGEGPAAGQPAVLLLGDRVALTPEALARPLHRDVASFTESVGADRLMVEHQTEHAIVGNLRFGSTWVRALLDVRGARVTLACLDADRNLARGVTAWQRDTAARQRALARLRDAIGAAVAEAIPFDRPRGVPDHFSDGRLRPLWRWAYDHRQASFTHDEQTYPVFDGRGRPIPPQMCADFVFDTYERAGGSWYRPRPESPGRSQGRLDFDRYGIDNRRGVLALGEFAAKTPELFEHRWFTGAERVAFAERGRFFSSLSGDSDRLRPGDVVAIQGEKADGYVHQHAILVEATDPLTGFPHALADQMRWPRRRTWEGIMAEAPRRSLLYRVRPTRALFELVAGPDTVRPDG